MALTSRNIRYGDFVVDGKRIDYLVAPVMVDE